MLRSILVALGDQSEDEAALEYAYVLTQACKATLFGHLVIDISEASTAPWIPENGINTLDGKTS